MSPLTRDVLERLHTNRATRDILNRSGAPIPPPLAMAIEHDEALLGFEGNDRRWVPMQDEPADDWWQWLGAGIAGAATLTCAYIWMVS